jgi:hypothetical protein
LYGKSIYHLEEMSNSFGKLEGMNAIERPGRIWKDQIKVHLKDLTFEDDWLALAKTYMKGQVE